MKQETIEILRERAEDIEVFVDNEEDNLKELRKESREDYVKLGELYLMCHIILKQNLYKFKEKKEGEDKKEDQEFKEFKEYFGEIEIDEEFEENLEYRKSKKFGSCIREEKIRDYVKEKRKDINNFIDLFFEIFIQDI